MQTSIQSTFNLTQRASKSKYLGIPLFLHHKKSIAFEDLKSKISSRISGWKSKFLSQAGRTTLIKTAANEIPAYKMFLFLFPKSFCLDLDVMLRIFWWGFPQEKNKNLTLLSWKSICTPKSIGALELELWSFKTEPSSPNWAGRFIPIKIYCEYGLLKPNI